MCWNKGTPAPLLTGKNMANDRMYIRCKGCGDLHYLAKCYDDGYFTTHEGEELRQGLDDFFDRHKWCYRSIYGGFELVYESDELTNCQGCLYWTGKCKLPKGLQCPEKEEQK
jgi:hypothetical protein